ncbi:hypothetical protein FZC79_11315 [Rossellomorea vietnamensis]|uniref:Uncharacterized protein n=1 Tax=Rossellomorea vietnamensis TaxID=218284 RepID=A0A5D4KDF0_9BACI|nr:hypothetical protein FZC79_11315 [Rossellomorea vietnamensis]
MNAILPSSTFTYEDWSGRRTTSCGTSGTGETPQAQPRRLTARPAESSTWSGNPLLLNNPQFLGIKRKKKSTSHN